MPDSALARKLGIRAGHRLLVLNAPQGYAQRLSGLPGVAPPETSASGQYDFVLAFAHSRAEVEALAAPALQALKPAGLLWFSYPKKTSLVKTDISRDSGWEPLGRQGLRPVSLVAIDDTWSALRFRPVEQVRLRQK